MRSLLAVLHVIGALLACFALYFVPPIVLAACYAEWHALRGFIVGGLISAVVGVALYLLTRRYRQDLKPRDAFLLVSGGWLSIAAVATTPLLVDVPGLSYTRAYFETMSALSTTGATMLQGLDQLPHCLNLWRHALSWLGGMGIIVFGVAILPLLGIGGMHFYRTGAAGGVKETKFAPRITETARILSYVYGGLTVACALALWAAGMSAFDAVCHAFSTVALGGFSTHDANIGYFHSPLIESIMTVFMLIAAMNFATHFTALRRGDLTVYRRDPEARWMLLLVLGSALAVALFLEWRQVYPSFPQSLRYATFNVASLATSGGFFSTDYGAWPAFAPLWMLLLSCICASTGSPGGGIRMFRAALLMKQSLREMFALVHPQAVSPVRIAGHVVPNRMVYSVLAFLVLYILTIAVLTFALLISGLDLTSALSAIVACINNVGPGLGLVGPGHGYAALNGPQAWICIAAMFLGRVEIISFAVLFTPSFWRK